MRKSYTKGVRWLILFTLAMAFGSHASIMSTINGFKDPKMLYQEGDYFSGRSGYSIIKILGIEELTIEDEKLDEDEKFYMVESEHAFVILKSTREDLKNVIGDRLGVDDKLKVFKQEEVYARIDAIPEKSRGRRSTRTNITPELSEKFRKSTQSSSLVSLRMADLREQYKTQSSVLEKVKERPFYSKTYIVPSGRGYHIFNIIFSSGLTIVTIFMIYAIIRKIRWIINNYNRLFKMYPEVERDMERLLLDSSYIDKKLKILIYKNSIIVFKNIFEFEELSNIKNITFNRLSYKGKITGYTINIGRYDRKNIYNIKIAKGKEENIERINKLATHLRREYKIKVNNNI